MDWKKRYIVFLILPTLAMLSCRKEGLPDPPPCNTCETDTLLVWHQDLDTLSGQESLFANPILYKGNPIFMIHDGWDCNFGSANRVTCLDAESGEKLWGFDIEEDCKEIYGGFIYQDYLVLNIPNQVLCYDLKTMTNSWIFDLPAGVAGSVGFLGINDKVYLSATSEPQIGEETAFLFEITVLNGKVREISHFYKDDWGASPIIHPPSLWIDPTSGDSLLIVAVGLYMNQGPFDDRQSLHAYDLKTGTFRWQVDSIGIPTNNNKRMEVYDNRVYVPTDWRIHCFDAFTGIRIWEAEMPNNTQQIDFSYSRPFAVKGKLIANSTSEEMYCFDAYT